MEALAGNNSLINKQFLRKLWLQKLPVTIQSCKIPMEETHTQEQFFTVADKIGASTDKPKISSISIKALCQNANTSKAEYQDLKRFLITMTARIEQLEKEISRSRPRFRSNSNYRDYSRTRSKNRSSSRINAKKSSTHADITISLAISLRNVWNHASFNVVLSKKTKYLNFSTGGKSWEYFTLTIQIW